MTSGVEGVGGRVEEVDGVDGEEFVYHNAELTEDCHEGSVVRLRYGFGPIPAQNRDKRVFYFDIDNCLYQRSTKIHDLMQEKIHQYFKHHLNLKDEDAYRLHMKYYKTYGLALEGLVRNHLVDAMEYNSQVDDALDLKSVLHFNRPLRTALQSLRKTGHFDYFWLITNAYKNHALRVISFLGLGDLFDGLTFCDYAAFPIVCKPMDEFFHRCLSLTNIDYNNTSVMAKQLFVDDSEINVKAAHNLGFGTVIHYIETDQDLAQIQQKPDFCHYYGHGDNSDPSKIYILRNILDIVRFS